MDNQTVFSLDDGTREIKLCNPYGKTICTMHFRPGDPSIMTRYKAFMRDFNVMLANIAKVDAQADSLTDEVLLDTISKAEAELLKRLDTLFDSDDVSTVFATRSPLSLVNGVPFATIVLELLGNVIKQEFESQQPLNRPHVRKHLDNKETEGQ